MILFNAIGSAGEVEHFWNSLRMSDANKPRLNILISFVYLRGQIKRLIELKQDGKIGKIFLDSGTYTINIRESTLNPLLQSRFDEYAHFLSMYIDHFDYAAAYDEDFSDWELNMFLLGRLENRIPPQHRNKIIPVVHKPGEGAIGEFCDLVDMGYDYIAIGSKPWPTDDTWETIQQKIKAYKDATPSREIKTHLFGTISEKNLVTRRPFSSDASSFAKAAAFDTVMIWNEQKNKMEFVALMEKTPTKEELAKGGVKTARSGKPISRDQKHEIAALFGNGFTPDDLISSVEKRHMVNFYAVTQLEKYLNDLYRKEPVS